RARPSSWTGGWSGRSEVSAGAPISKKLDTKTLLDLNYAVEVEGKAPEAVARQWLRENGFVE
ncbi:MAG: glycine/betaine ABC transporter substrate-binding protein, partial [Actinomycetota bacterium]|nr:glycine/betaine ABC transporter substrate-binding protein [Actinomycetota bacterium]